jgi:hypothetical protein
MSTDQSTAPAEPSTGPLVLVIQPDGTATTERLPASGTPAQDREQLAAINDTVGGYFTTIGDGLWLALVNEDGERLALPPNHSGHLLARALGFRFQTGDYLLGPIIFVSRQGEELGDVGPAVLELARQAGVIE